MNWKMKRDLSYKISFSEFKASLTTNKLAVGSVTNNGSNMKPEYQRFDFQLTKQRLLSSSIHHSASSQRDRDRDRDRDRNTDRETDRQTETETDTETET